MDISPLLKDMVLRFHPPASSKLVCHFSTKYEH